MINSANKKRIELLIKRNTKHGQAGTPTYIIWKSMIGRCERPTDSSYKYYGAKGVTVCERWHDFQNFFEDMGEAPKGSHLHRTDGSTIYSSATCQWLNEKEHIGLHNKERGWGARMTKAQLIKELAAEREKGFREAARIYKPARDEDRQQLLAALAAIEKHNKRDPFLPFLRIDVDLSALREHDAEVRKPLVEVLEGIAKGDTSVSAEEFANSCIFTARAALASVKEGK